MLRGLEHRDGEDFRRLVQRLKISPEEIQEWAKAAEAMSIPYDAASGINPQDSHFLDRGMGSQEHAAGQVPLTAELSPSGDLPLPGAQAGRRRSRAVPPR